MAILEGLRKARVGRDAGGDAGCGLLGLVVVMAR